MGLGTRGQQNKMTNFRRNHLRSRNDMKIIYHHGDSPVMTLRSIPLPMRTLKRQSQNFTSGQGHAVIQVSLFHITGQISTIKIEETISTSPSYFQSWATSKKNGWWRQLTSDDLYEVTIKTCTKIPQSRYHITASFGAKWADLMSNACMRNPNFLLVLYRGWGDGLMPKWPDCIGQGNQNPMYIF